MEKKQNFRWDNYNKDAVLIHELIKGKDKKISFKEDEELLIKVAKKMNLENNNLKEGDKIITLSAILRAGLVSYLNS